MAKIALGRALGFCLLFSPPGQSTPNPGRILNLQSGNGYHKVPCELKYFKSQVDTQLKMLTFCLFTKFQIGEESSALVI